MANSLGTTYTSLIWPTALSLLNTVRPALSLFTTDFHSDQVAYGAGVVTRVRTIGTVNNFGTGATDRADTDVTVTMNLHKEVHHAFTVAQYTQQSRDLLQESAEPIAYAIANNIVDAVAALIPGAFTANTAITLANGWNYDHLVDVRTAMQAAGIPESQRYYLCNSTVYGTLLKDDRIVEALKNPMNQNAIATGKLPMVAGLTIAEYPALPTTSNLCAFAGTKESLIVTCRVQADPAMGSGVPYPGRHGTVTDAATGFSITLDEYIAPANNVFNTRASWMYGVDQGNENTGIRIVTA